MRTQVVYTLVSSPEDNYAWQAYVSVLSLRHHNADAKVLLLCDDKTAEYVKEHALIHSVDEIIVPSLPENLTAMQKSRYLKTGLRQYVDGDVLFIDTDTLIVSPIDEIDELEAGVAAVLDAHTPLADNPYLEMITRDSHLVGNDLSGISGYYNSGVIFSKGDEMIGDFYRKWNENYRCGQDSGVKMDQPYLAKTDAAFGHIIKELPGVWNCQLRHGVRFLKDAKIVHYLWTAKRTENPFVLGRPEIWKKIRNSGEIPPEVFALFDDPFRGIQDMTYLASSEETSMFNGRTYKVLCKFEHESPAFNSLLKFCVRVLDATYKLIYRKHGTV